MALIQGHILAESVVFNEKNFSFELFGRAAFGPFKIIINNQKPVFFVDSEAKLVSDHLDHKQINLTQFDGRKVAALYSQNFNEFERLKEKALSLGIRTFEQDVPLIERFLMERFIFREIEFEGESGESLFINPNIRGVKGLNTSFIYTSLDIETGVNGELFSIALDYGDTHKTKRDGIVLMVGPSDQSSDKILFFETEKEVLLKFEELVTKIDPDFIYGWHVIGFDLKFLFDKAQRLGMDLNIGRDKTKLVVEEKNNNTFHTLKGRVVIDGPVMMRSNFYTFSDYKLETVAQDVLGAGKDIASDETKVEEIERRFREDKMRLAKYNLLDAELVTDIYFKTGLVDLLLERSKLSGLSIDKVHFSSASFDFIYLPLFHRKGFVAPNISDINREFESSGGLVLDTKTGLHDDVIVIDFKSLYPTLMITFNIDPYSYLKGKTEGREIPSGHKFSMQEAPLSSKLKEFLDRRKRAKESGNKELSQAIKILMNSFYGILGSSRSRFYQADLPMAITQTGQWILKTTKNFIEKEGFEVLYGDTDSLFVKMHKEDKFQVSDVANRLVKKINDYLETIISRDFGRTSHLEIEYEKHFSKIFFPLSRDGLTGAKKRYVGLINGEVDFVGMEFVRSDWTILAKNFQLKIFEALFEGSDLEALIKKYCKELEEGLYDKDLVYTKRLSKDPREYTKNIPPHVKAALMVNHTGPYRLKKISYMMTLSGPVPEKMVDMKQIDYNHYKEKQIKPIADNVLIYLGKSWDSIMIGDQLSLF